MDTRVKSPVADANQGPFSSTAAELKQLPAPPRSHRLASRAAPEHEPLRGGAGLRPPHLHALLRVEEGPQDGHVLPPHPPRRRRHPLHRGPRSVSKSRGSCGWGRGRERGWGWRGGHRVAPERARNLRRGLHIVSRVNLGSVRTTRGTGGGGW